VERIAMYAAFDCGSSKQLFVYYKYTRRRSLALHEKAASKQTVHQTDTTVQSI
jgi:hypothetical protein